jgi:predicted HTH transcriptional regulator
MNVMPNEVTKLFHKRADVIAAVKAGRLTEHRHDGVELKSSWTVDYGRKLSALGNHVDRLLRWMVIGVSDEGALLNHSEKWARQTEQVLSQHVNDKLSPSQACVSITCHEVDGAWLVLGQVQNPGDVVYWDDRAYGGAGTTIAELSPTDVMKLRIQLPGLMDFSRQPSTATPVVDLVRSFEDRIRQAATPIEGSGNSQADIGAVVQALGLTGTQAERILFGDCSFRFVRYNVGGEPIQNDRITGVYTLLTNKFQQELQEWARGVLHMSGLPFPSKALQEAMANSVAHAAYYESDGDLIVEQYPDKVTISNLCLRESAYFANRWFSRSHKTVNGLLMEALRVARHVDELGRGKHLIFSESIRNGKTAPLVVVERAARYDRWKLTRYGGSQDETALRLFDRCRDIYRDDQKALIAQALVLWRDRPVADIRDFIDGEFARQFAEVLSSLEGPSFYYKKNDQITLRRWAAVLIGEGKDSKILSPAEDKDLRDFAYDMQTKFHGGFITPKELRRLGAMANTKSEQVLSSTILKNWERDGTVKRVRRGQYRFVRRPPAAAATWQDLLELFKVTPEGGAGS